MGSRGNVLGRNNAKVNQASNCFNEIALRTSSSIAASMKGGTELMEEQNSLHALTINEFNTEEEKCDRE